MRKKYKKNYCESCGRDDLPLDAHHINPYIKLSFQEKLFYDFKKDIKTLCWKCHFYPSFSHEEIKKHGWGLDRISRKGGTLWWYRDQEGVLHKKFRPKWMSKKIYDSIYEKKYR